jgi:hypothetical protein
MLDLTGRVEATSELNGLSFRSTLNSNSELSQFLYLAVHTFILNDGVLVSRVEKATLAHGNFQFNWRWAQAQKMRRSLRYLSSIHLTKALST